MRGEKSNKLGVEHLHFNPVREKKRKWTDTIVGKGAIVERRRRPKMYLDIQKRTKQKVRLSQRAIVKRDFPTELVNTTERTFSGLGRGE